MKYKFLFYFICVLGFIFSLSFLNTKEHVVLQNKSNNSELSVGKVKTEISQYSVDNVKVYQNNKLIFSGTRDLTNSVKNILENNSPYKVFNNREKLLPIKEKNYYREYDVFTKEWTLSTRGPERIIVGKKGEMYYTSDHYKSFFIIK